MSDDIPELDGEKLSTNDAPHTFANKVISITELEKSSGSYQVPPEFLTYKNITMLSGVIKPKDQVNEPDDEWNYDQLHTEISSIVRIQYGEKI